MKHSQNSSPDCIKQAVQKRTIMSKERTKIRVYCEDAVAVNDIGKF